MPLRSISKSFERNSLTRSPSLGFSFVSYFLEMISQLFWNICLYFAHDFFGYHSPRHLTWSKLCQLVAKKAPLASGESIGGRGGPSLTILEDIFLRNFLKLQNDHS